MVMMQCGIDLRDGPNCCNLNLYEGGCSSVGPHADNEQLFSKTGKHRDLRIISLSIGATRDFVLKFTSDAARRNDLPWFSRDLPYEDGAKIELRSGDICTMEGLAQKHYVHSLPVSDRSGTRVNITWRWITKHMPYCCAGKSHVGKR